MMNSSRADKVISRGDRIAQLTLEKDNACTLVRVTKGVPAPAPKKRVGGFGSTGK
jgi:dUTPase